MLDTTFINGIKDGGEIGREENVFSGIWSEYERVIVESLVSSFGLDFLIRDQKGGDVDTIQTVRKVGFKNKDNEEAYEQRGDYDTAAYHSEERFIEIKRSAREEFDQKGTMLKDAYTGKENLKPRNNPTIPREEQGQLDHVIPAKVIHDDPGRILAEMDGVDLANDPGNLRFTNACMNRIKSDKTVEDFISWCEENPDQVNWNGTKGEPLSEEVKERLRNEYNRAKKEYDAKLGREYYTSSKFAKDTAKAAGKTAAKMGLRQVVGFIFAEIWFVTKEEVKNIPPGSGFGEMLKAAGNGIKKGFESAIKKYKTLLDRFAEGAVSGALSSLITTLCNIFFVTAKSLVRCLRQMFASIVAAAKVLFCNPENLNFGDRIKAVMIILATGASVLVGTIAGEAISKTPLGVVPALGGVISAFASCLVSGILSCTFLIFMDRSEFINNLVNALNRIPSEANNYKEIADAMENLAAKLEKLDIEKFKEDTERFRGTAQKIFSCEDEEKITVLLLESYNELGIKIPWEGDFDSFMGCKTNCLEFE